MPMSDVRGEAESSSNDLVEGDGRKDHQSGRQGSQDSRLSGSSTVATHNDPIAGNHSKRQASQHGDTRERVEHRPTSNGAGRLVTVAEVVLAAVGVGTLIITAVQLSAMKVQNKAIRNANIIATAALKSADRAWLYPIFTYSENESSGGIDLITKIVNNGRTPAFKVRYKLFVSTYASGISRFSPFPDLKNEKESISLPSSTETIVTSFDKNAFDTTSPKYPRIDQIIAMGSMSYSDIFGDDHKTQICRLFIVKTKSFDSCPNELTSVVN